MEREFVSIFDEWVHSYNLFVEGHDPEYRDVFERYDEILSEVANRAVGRVLEFGTGTGNLTAKLLDRGLEVVGVEPNEAMRKVTSTRFPGLEIKDEDLLDFEVDENAPIDTFVSTYVFHHLNDEAKGVALKKYASLLPVGGKIIFADTAFKTEEAKQAQIQKERERSFMTVVEDLEREYYTTIPVLEDLFATAGFTIQFSQLNDYVWLMDATKKSGGCR